MRVAIPNMAGFTEQSIKDMFEGAGLTDVKYRSVWKGAAPAPPPVLVTIFSRAARSQLREFWDPQTIRAARKKPRRRRANREQC